MIAEVDEALCRALAQVLPKGTVVRLDPPKPTWQTEKPSQAIDLFLFNLAGDDRRLMSGYDEVRDADGRVLSRQDPARRYFLSYLVTARAPKIAEEHELLDTALRALTDNEALPISCLPDALLETGMPVYVDLDPAGPGHLWTSLGMPARAAFVLSVSAPYRPVPDTELAPPADKLDLRGDVDYARQAPPVAASAGQPAGAAAGNGPAAAKRWVRIRTEAKR
ncbi:MAG TPA: Pvc16 family protein [Jatrophihabitans sp.]|nr:Pvc16 family protein [Jatrophihabitans sp.]